MKILKSIAILGAGIGIGTGIGVAAAAATVAEEMVEKDETIESYKKLVEAYKHKTEELEAVLGGSLTMMNSREKEIKELTEDLEEKLIIINSLKNAMDEHDTDIKNIELKHKTEITELEMEVEKLLTKISNLEKKAKQSQKK